MLFNSFEFAAFFVVVFASYWALKRWHRAQNNLLLAASLLFYGSWDVRFLYLFLLTTVVDFFCAMMIGQGQVPTRQRALSAALLMGSAFLCVTCQWSALGLHGTLIHPALSVHWGALLPRDLSHWAVFLATTAVVLFVNSVYPWMTRLPELTRRRVFIWASVTSNLGVLGFFKYYNFFADSFTRLAQAMFHVTPSTWTLRIILPVGISFYTFQSLAYTIDVYRRRIPPMDRYLPLATFLSFFPQLVAGPIERASNLLPQFGAPRTLNYDQFRGGMWLMFWGLFKKVVVADHAALIVNAIFGPYDGAFPSTAIPHDGLRLLVGLYAFAVQIYGDFSGYTDMARGAARLLGFDLMLNFKLPYFAISPSDFWRRWHISLSSWLRDYLYIPLGGNRQGPISTYRNLFLTMLLGGLWHGARWTFVLWGAYHGILLIGYRLLAPGLGEGQRAAKAGVAVMPGGALVMTTYSMLAPVPVSFGQPARRLIMGAARHALLVLLMFQLTCLGWLLFRAQSLTAIRVFLHSIVMHPHWSVEAASALRDLAFYSWFLLGFQIMQAAMGTLDPMKRLHWFVRLNIWVFVIMSLLAFTEGKAQSFIYFAF